MCSLQINPNLFGKPNEGLHSYRIFGYAAFDLFATLIVAIFIARKYKLSTFFTFLSLFTLGEVLHYIIGVKTKFIRDFFQ